MQSIGSYSFFRIKIITAIGPKGSKQKLYKWQCCQGNSSEQVDSSSLEASWEHILSPGCCVTSSILLEEDGNRLLQCSFIILLSTPVSCLIPLLSYISCLKLSEIAFEKSVFSLKQVICILHPSYQLSTHLPKTEAKINLTDQQVLKLFKITLPGAL